MRSRFSLAPDEGPRNLGQTDLPGRLGTVVEPIRRAAAVPRNGRQPAHDRAAQDRALAAARRFNPADEL